MSQVADVVILGAGVAGLAAAHELVQQGRRTILFEAAAVTGGLSRTVEHKGFRFDLGGHRWFTKNAELDAWFHRLMGQELVPVDRVSRVHFEGRYFLYPLDLADLIRQAGVPFLLGAATSALASTLRAAFRRKAPTNMQEAYVAQFGPVLFDTFFRRYSEKVWGRPCTQLSADWVSQRSKGLSIISLLKSTIGFRQRGVTSLIEQFYYPATGFGRLAARMAEDIECHGGEIHLRSKVTAVRYHGPADFEVSYETQGQLHSLRARNLLSTIPLGMLVEILSPACPEPARLAAKSLQFRDLITVNLIVRRDRVSPDTWIYVQDSDILFGRLHEPKNWSGAMVPEAGYTSLVLECFCSRDEPLWRMQDDAIVKRCIEDLDDRLGLLSAHEVTDHAVVRTLNAYPIYDLDYEQKLQAIQGALEEFEGLHCLGRSGTFRYNNSDHSVEMGLLLGRRLCGHAVDHLGVNTEAEYHELIDHGRKPARDSFTLRPRIQN